MEVAQNSLMDTTTIPWHPSTNTDNRVHLIPRFPQCTPFPCPSWAATLLTATRTTMRSLSSSFRHVNPATRYSMKGHHRYFLFWIDCHFHYLGSITSVLYYMLFLALLTGVILWVQQAVGYGFNYGQEVIEQIEEHRSMLVFDTHCCAHSLHARSSKTYLLISFRNCGMFAHKITHLMFVSMAKFVNVMQVD